jgi:hypothetical protein
LSAVTENESALVRLEEALRQDGWENLANYDPVGEQEILQSPRYPDVVAHIKNGEVSVVFTGVP